jgi:hypothetical protein
MANTTTLISSSTVGAGGAASISFTSIPQTYRDLYLVVTLRGTSAAGPESYFAYADFNGVSTNRTYKRIEGYGGGSGSDTGSLGPIAVAGGTGVSTGIFSAGHTYIANYTSSNAKNYSSNWGSENNGSAFDLGFISGLWTSSAALTSITIYLSTGNLAQYSSASLYGIKNS